MRKPEEIKEGLKCCEYEKQECNHCSYSNEIDCNGIESDAIAYIEQLESQIDSLCCDFMDYVNSGVPNPASYCAFASELCVDSRGWCKPGSETCNGFVPKVRDDNAEV